MKAPLSWLKEYVDIDCSVQKLEEKLFSCGFEVEESIFVGKNIDKIVYKNNLNLLILINISLNAVIENHVVFNIFNSISLLKIAAIFNIVFLINLLNIKNNIIILKRNIENIR